MSSFADNALLRVACGLYRAMLYVYPPEFRRRYCKEMRQAFRDQLRDTLSTRSAMDLWRFCIRMAWDMAVSAMKERFSWQNAPGICCLAGAICVGLYGAHVDRHNATEVYPTLLVVLVGSFLLGVIRPFHAWRWALIVGLGVPFSGPLATLTTRLASPSAWAILAVVLIPGLIGAYTGSILRRAAGVMQ